MATGPVSAGHEGCVPACPTPKYPRGTLGLQAPHVFWNPPRVLTGPGPVPRPAPLKATGNCTQPRTDGTRGTVPGGLGEARISQTQTLVFRLNYYARLTWLYSAVTHSSLPAGPSSRPSARRGPVFPPGAFHSERLWPQRRGLPGDLWWPDSLHRHQGPHRAGLATSAQAAFMVHGICAST